MEFNEEIWGEISLKGKDLVIQCLTLDPNIRITAARALEHPWIVYIYFLILRKILKDRKKFPQES